MKQIIEIEVPEGKKAVWKDGKVVFEDIMPELPKTWEEFCTKYPLKKGEVYITDISDIEHLCLTEKRFKCQDRNVLPSEEAAEAHLALMQLHQLRDCYRQGWVSNGDLCYGIVMIFEGKNLTPRVTEVGDKSVFLSFETIDIAKKFLYYFEELIKKAGDLI